MTTDAQKVTAMRLMEDCTRVSNDMIRLRHRCNLIASLLAQDKEPNQQALESLAAIEEQLRKAQHVIVCNALKLVLNYLQNS